MLAENRKIARVGQIPKVAVGLPSHIARALNQFLVDRKTGNVKLNIKDGEILGCHVEEIVSAHR